MKDLVFTEEAQQMESIMNAVRAIRNRRSEMNVPPSRKTMLYIASARPELFIAGQAIFQRLAYATNLEAGTAFDIPGAVTIVTPDAQIFIPMEELVDRGRAQAPDKGIGERAKAVCDSGRPS